MNSHPDTIAPAASSSSEKPPSHPAATATTPKQFPWPLILILSSLIVLALLLAWNRVQQDFTSMLHFIWIACCSVLPAIAILVLLGSLAQIRKRPVLSSLSFLLGLLVLLSCFWAVQKLIQLAEMFPS